MTEQSSQTDQWRPTSFDVQLEDIQNTPLLKQVTNASTVKTLDASA